MSFICECETSNVYSDERQIRCFLKKIEALIKRRDLNLTVEEYLNDKDVKTHTSLNHFHIDKHLASMKNSCTEQLVESFIFYQFLKTFSSKHPKFAAKIVIPDLKGKVELIKNL